MTDRPGTPSDRTSEQQGQKDLNAATAGLNLCSPSFNDAYKGIQKLQLGKLTGQEMKEELMDAVEDRLNKNGCKIEEVAGDPENYQSAISDALQQAKDGLALEGS
jgi:hypothetical protein